MSKFFIADQGKMAIKHTLHPSQSFLTELLTFIPRICSCMPFAIIALFESTAVDAFPIIGLRRALVASVDCHKHRAVEVVHAIREICDDRKLLNNVVAVRRRKVWGAILERFKGGLSARLTMVVEMRAWPGS
jgi:hypothetical protein